MSIKAGPFADKSHYRQNIKHVYHETNAVKYYFPFYYRETTINFRMIKIITKEFLR